MLPDSHLVSLIGVIDFLSRYPRDIVFDRFSRYVVCQLYPHSPIKPHAVLSTSQCHKCLLFLVSKRLISCNHKDIESVGHKAYACGDFDCRQGSSTRAPPTYSRDQTENSTRWRQYFVHYSPAFSFSFFLSPRRWIEVKVWVFQLG